MLGLPDTSLSWYGAAGAVVILGGVAAAIVGVRRAVLRRGALVLALAPLGLVVVFAFTIVYDPWRGRLAMFAVGLACAVWGSTSPCPVASVGIAGLCVTTVVLSLVHSYTKPSGLGHARAVDLPLRLAPRPDRHADSDTRLRRDPGRSCERSKPMSPETPCSGSPPRSTRFSPPERGRGSHGRCASSWWESRCCPMRHGS